MSDVIEEQTSEPLREAREAQEGGRPTEAKPNATADERTLVRARSGWLRGSVEDDVVNFKGIPFAAPPVGSLRWRPPQPAIPWEGVRLASEYGSIAAQPVKTDNGIGPGDPSEDCLTLNIFAPTQAGSSPLPVMVWIHGGGLSQGSSSAALYDGSALARQGVVVVTINYRLGVFGFFAHPALTRESNGGATANFGLMDQIAALEWVRDNIAVFGGDPAQVTIFGESAGAISVNCLMTSQLATGLFHRAISQSAIGRLRSQSLTQAEESGKATAATLGVVDDDLDALRAIPMDQIVSALGADSNSMLLTGRAPIIDGLLLTENPVDAFEAGREAGVPLLVGATDLELPPLYRPESTRGWLEVSGERRSSLIAAYGGEEAFVDYFASDISFAEPAAYLGELHSRRHLTFCYRFAIQPDIIANFSKGAPHASDVPYVFLNTSAAAWPLTERDRELAEAVSAYWASFAKSGDPNSSANVRWPAYDGRSIMVFTNDGPVATEDPWVRRFGYLRQQYQQVGVMPLIGNKGLASEVESGA